MLRLFLDRFNFLFLKVLVSSFTLIGYISISYDLSLSEQRSGYESIIITANSLTVDNETKIAIFEGSVKAVKGDITLYADKMTVHYQNEKARR
ncbi:MAG: LptA/OstA family protein, partial [Thermodesulfovibrionales bacterium]|nr:LptA/OstA family protein [Thermodesulfovibrionales bacterium]